MPLTAAEVRGTKFSTTRMRAGYDMDEVDAFLDIVEADVAQYTDDLQRSREGLVAMHVSSAHPRVLPPGASAGRRRLVPPGLWRLLVVSFSWRTLKAAAE